MADPADVGGKLWVDNGGVEQRFTAQNMNKLRPGGFVARSGVLAVDVAQARWFTDSVFKTFPGVTLSLAPSTTTYIWLDGAEPDGSILQLKSNTTGFPVPATDALLYVAEVVTNATDVLTVTNLNTRRSLAGSGTLTDVLVTAPLAKAGPATAPTISIPASGLAQDGFMSASQAASLSALAYASPGDIIQGATPGPGPSVLALGSQGSRLEVNPAGDALQYVTDPFPPSLKASVTASWNFSSVPPTVIDGMSLLLQPGTWKVDFGSSVIVNQAAGPGVTFFFEIFLNGVATGSKRRLNSLSGSGNVPQDISIFDIVTVPAGAPQIVDVRVSQATTANGESGTFFDRNIAAFRVAP